MSKDGAVILDLEIFQTLSNLMGDVLGSVLEQHLKTVDEYLRIIESGLVSSDFKAIFEAAHPLKSASQQIGALKVAALAKEIEAIAQQPTPDVTRIKTLLPMLVEAHAKTIAKLKPYLRSTH